MTTREGIDQSPARTETSAAVAHSDQCLATMFKVARFLIAERDPQAIVPYLLASLIESIPAADAGILMAWDASAGYLHPIAAQGFDLNALEELQILPGEAVIGSTFERGVLQHYETPEEISSVSLTMRPENALAFTAATAGRPPPLSAVSIPLTTDGTSMGVLFLASYQKSGGFDPEDFAFLHPVADLLAVAVENLRLRQQRDAVRSIEETDRIRAEAISTLAHEMRTPLTSIKGYSTALLAEEISFGPETQQEFLQIIAEQCGVLEDLIHDLLESSAIDAGLLRLELDPVRLPRVAKDVTDDFAHASPKHRFVLDFPPDFPMVEADAQRIIQVLRNLVDNAVKYSPDGGLVVVRGEVLTSEVMISVADQGVGLAPEHLNRLFEKFFRVKSGTGRHVVGSGLGLPISRAIVESHGGRIWAESQVGQGTTLSFTVPLETGESAAQAARVEEA